MEWVKMNFAKNPRFKAVQIMFFNPKPVKGIIKSLNNSKFNIVFLCDSIFKKIACVLNTQNKFMHTIFSANDFIKKKT